MRMELVNDKARQCQVMDGVCSSDPSNLFHNVLGLVPNITNVVHSATKSIIQSAYCKAQAVKYATLTKWDMSEIFEHWLRCHLIDN